MRGSLFVHYSPCFARMSKADPELTPRTVGEHLLHNVRGYTVFALNPAGEIAVWSAGGRELTGYCEEDVAGRPLSTLWSEERKEEPWLLFEAALRDGGASTAGWVRRKDGTTFWAEETLSVIRVDSEPVGFSVVLRDETERKQLHEALRRSEATFEGILAIATDAIVSISEAQRITFFNYGAETMFGYSREEVIGQPLEILIPEGARADHPGEVRGFAASAVTARRMGERGEITGRRKDGEIFPAEASISKLEIGGGLIFTAVLRDVTERRRANEELAATARDLARSNAELEQFAYVASHDLQEPLRMVASYTQLLARRYKGQLDADADEFIGYAIDGVTRMQALINDLLAYSRVGSREREHGRVDMDALLERTLKNLGPTIEDAGATVTHDRLPPVLGDPGQLEQLLQNLIANAVKFRGENAPRVHVSARDEDGERIFSVSDNGIGIAAEFRDRIFVIFQRLHSRAEYPGTGIGLSICRKIVERHGGRIWVESTPGGGATFCFTLPVPGTADD